MAFLYLWGSFSIGVIVAACLFSAYLSYDWKFGLFAQEHAGELPSESAPRNFKRAFNPITNIVEVFWRPSVKGIGASKAGGTAYTLERLSEGLEPEGPDPGEGDGVRMKGFDGLRALLFLWVLAYELDEFLAELDADYKDSMWYKDKDSKIFLWKVAGAGYLGFNGFLVLSAFLCTYAHIKAEQDFMNGPEASALDSSAKFFSTTMPLIYRRVARLWPALMAGVFFVGFLWPYYISSDNEVVRGHFFGKCEHYWWTNAFFIANFWKSECYVDTWAVSVLFQLMFLVPIPASMYAQGDTMRTYAYVVVYGVITLSLLSRFLTVYLLDIEWSPLEEDHALNHFWVDKMPWCRAGEYCVGILVAFSVFDERADAPWSIFDIYSIVSEKFSDWLSAWRLLAVTTLQTFTIAAGMLFVYEGTLQDTKFDMPLSPTQRTVILVLGDLIVASFLGLMLRWASSALHGSWFRMLLSNPLLYPLASLSYSAFLFQLCCAYWATQILSQVYGHDIGPGYLYFSKAYFLTIALTVCVSLGVSVFIEKPITKLAELRE